jgi:hypothetical protein
VITDPSAPGYYSQVCDCPLTAHKDPAATGWPEHDPVPEVLTTDPWPADFITPKPPLDLRTFATAKGWLVRLGYSRGPERAVRVGTYKLTEHVGVWAAELNGWRWSAIHSRTVGKAWSWSAITIWRPGVGTRFTHATVTDLKEWLTYTSPPPPAWFKAVHARVEDQKERVRTAARNRPKTRKEGTS